MDEIKLGLAAQRGAQAQELLKSDIFNETLKYLESEYVSAWRRCVEKDTASRERLWTAVRILDHIKVHLATLVNNGKLATKDLANIKYLKR